MATEFQRAGGRWPTAETTDSQRHLPSRGVYVVTMPVLALLCLLLFPIVGVAQSLQPPRGAEQKGAGKSVPVPKQYLPPPGMCRIWVDNVPAARQPAPTDCETAIRNRPHNARVLFPPGKGGRSGEEKARTPPGPRPDTTKRKPPA